MPVYRGISRQSTQKDVFAKVGLTSLLLLAMSSQALAGIDPRGGTHADNVTSIAGGNQTSGVVRAHLAVVPQLMAPLGVSERASRWTRGRILKEVGKQAIEQPGHFLIGGAPIWAARCLVGVPWLGWAAAPVIVYREWLQWPSNRWWDPPLDWAFFTLGAVTATWSRRPGHRVMRGLSAIRQSLTSGLVFRGRMRPAA